MALVWDLDLEPNKRLVLLAYADHADDDGDNVYPSLPRIARKTGYSADQVRRISRELVMDGLMELVERGGGRGRPHRYRLTLEKGRKLPPLRERQKGGTKSEKGGTKGSKNLAPVPPEPSDIQNRQVIEPSESTTEKDFANAQSFSVGGGTNSANSAPPPQPEKKPERETSGQVQDLKQYAVAQLMERVEAARSRGAPIHDPLDSERGQYARFFAARAKRHDVDTLLMALDYLVAKASGEVEGEPKAWCGFDTALDRVLAGWRPQRSAHASPENERHWRMVEENRRMWAELLGDLENAS